MLFNPFLFVLGLMALIFSIPLMAIWTEHRRRVLELKLRLREAPSDKAMGELRELAREVAQLRDTTTQFDLSFDTALQRLEMRMNHMEERIQRAERGDAASDQPEAYTTVR